MKTLSKLPDEIWPIGTEIEVDRLTYISTGIEWVVKQYIAGSEESKTSNQLHRDGDIRVSDDGSVYVYMYAEWTPLEDAVDDYNTECKKKLLL